MEYGVQYVSKLCNLYQVSIEDRQINTWVRDNGCIIGAEKTENKAGCLFVQALASFLLSGRDRAVIFFFTSVQR